MSLRNMSKLIPTLLLSSSLFLLSALGVEAQSLLSPPYGQQWAETPDRFLSWAESQDLDIEITSPAENRAKRYIRAYSKKLGNKKLGVHSIEARYHHSQLYEVTVDYFDPKLSSAAAKTKHIEAKRAIVSQYGTMKPGEKSNSEKDGYRTEVVSYHIEPIGGLMLVILSTEVSDLLRKKSLFRFSLIYRNENVIINSRRQ